MSKKIRKSTSKKYVSRYYRKERVRNKISGTVDCPRLTVTKSDNHITVQLIDDDASRTLLQCSTMDRELRDSAVKANIAGAKKLGKVVAETAIKKNIKKAVFDRNGYKYHGAIKALADAAREAGLVI